MLKDAITLVGGLIVLFTLQFIVTRFVAVLLFESQIPGYPLLTFILIISSALASIYGAGKLFSYIFNKKD